MHKSMKKLFPLCTVSVLVLASGCSISHHDSKSQAAAEKSRPTPSETVLVTYYPAPGKDQELEAAMAHAWQVYRKDHLVDEEPHTIVRGTEGPDKSYYVEIFTWKHAPEHPSADVSAAWSEESSLCEAGEGHKGIEGGPVDAVAEK